MSSLFLAFDTSTDVLAIGLGRREGLCTQIVATHDVRARRAALSTLLPAARELLDGHGFRPADLGEIVVGRGPGSFTGVRIGVATAKGLAQGLDVPLYGVGTLDAVAWGLVGEVHGLVGVVGDAMRGEVYPALFEIDDRSATRLTPDRVSSPEQAARAFEESGRAITLAGDGLAKYHDVFSAIQQSQTVSLEHLHAPGGLGLVRAYGSALAAGDAGDGDPATVLPVYTRLSDAEENERTTRGEPEATVPDSGVDGPGGKA